MSAALITVPIWVLMLSFTLPVEIKFGPEKGRLVLVAVYVIFLFVSLFGQKYMELMGFDVTGVVEHFQNIPQAMIILILLGGSAVVFLLSLVISVKIIVKREF